MSTQRSGGVRLSSAAAHRPLVLLVLLGCGACAKRPPEAIAGQRVAVYRGEELSPSSDDPAPSRRRPVVGELVDRTADTVRVRTRPGDEPRSFRVDAHTRLLPQPPTSAADPWLVGDSLLRGRSRQDRRHWTVHAMSGDTVLLLGSQTAPTTTDVEERESPPLQRQVLRARPELPLVLGTLSIGAGWLIFEAAKSREPEPSESFFDIDGEDLVLAMLVSGLMTTGAGAIITAFIPRLGWDALEPDQIPRLRPWSDGDEGALELRWRIPVGAPHTRAP